MTMSSSISVSSSSTTTSILRQGPSNDINFISSMSTSSSSSLSSCNSSSRHRRRRSSSSSSSVHFPPDDTIITSIHTRPRTDKEDIPKLYYSSLQIRYFKQKYKDQHLFASFDCDKHHHHRQERCIDGGEQQSISSDDSTASSSSSDEENNLSCVISSLQRQQQLHDASKTDDTTKTMKTRQSRSTPRPDSSFWRTKVNWRWQSSSSTRKSTTAVANRASSSDRYGNRTSSYSRRDQVVGVGGSSHSYLLN